MAGGRVLRGNRNYAAISLEYMGYGYLRRGDYKNTYASGAYEAAAEEYLGTVDDYIVKRCKNNMAKIKSKQRNPDTVVNFYRPFFWASIDYFFTSPVQLFASELPIFHS